MHVRGVDRAGKGITLVISVSETVKHKIKKIKGRFLCMLLGTLGTSLIGNMLISKGATRARDKTF